MTSENTTPAPEPTVDPASIAATSADIKRLDMEARLKGLAAEFEAGNKMLADLQQKRNELEATMLRISGAMQIIQELLAPSTEQ